MPAEIVTYLGTTRSWEVTLRDSQGRAMTGLYTADDTLCAAVWSGEDQATLFTPTLAWIDPDAGTLAISITAAQMESAGITDATYHLSVCVTRTVDAQPVMAWTALLRV